jgi:CarboxypepD_reg-like domain/TonB dependent receptor/TonB-dependent Receptor Plug Domain
MKYCISILLAFVFFQPVFGQKRVVYKLRGIVRDSTDNTPMVGASVSINYDQMGILTDENGRFELPIPAANEISMLVKFVGYKTYREVILMKSDLDKDIKLLKVSNDLEEVIITNKANVNDIKRPILGVNTLSIKTLQKLPSAMGEIDILRGLQMLPGVTSVGEAANGVNIRGGTTDQNLLLIDDMPVFNPTHTFGLFSAFPSEAISSFDLYKGTVPARFGGRAASVLDVSLSQPSFEKFRMQGGVSIVSNRIKMDIPIIKDKLAMMIAGRGAFNDFLLPIVSDKLKGIKAKFGDGATKIVYKVNQKNTMTFSGYYSRDFFQTQILGTVGSVNATSTQYDYQTVGMALKWFHAINAKTNIQTAVISSEYVPVTLLPEFNSDNKVSIKSGIDFKQFKSNVNYYTGKHKIEGGISGILYNINPGELNPGSSLRVNAFKTPNEQAIESALHIEDEVILSKKMTVSAALRYSYYTNIGAAKELVYEGGNRDALSVIDTINYAKGKTFGQYGGFEPRIGLQYSFSEQTSLKLGYNLMRQYIQVVTNTTTPLPTARWKTSDSHIKPQISQMLMAGVFHNFKDNIYEMTVEGYYRTTANVIDYKPGADFLLNAFPESQLLQGQNRSYGLELMVSKKKGDATGWINYTYSRSLNQVNTGTFFDQKINFGNWYPSNYDRPHSFNTTVVLGQGKHHDFSFNFTYGTGRPFTTPKSIVVFQGTNYPFYDVRNNARIPDYHRLDFAWNIYNPRMKEQRFKSHWTFTVYNLYGRKNAYSVFLRTQNNSIKAYKLIIFGSPIPSLSYNFKF